MKFEAVLGAWIAESDETLLSRMFDMSSKSKQKLINKRRSKLIVKIYANIIKTGYRNLRVQGCDFVSLT